MTCAHVVNVALKKVPGVDTVEVSPNQGRASVKLKPGNTVSVPQFWQLLHGKGYTPKATVVSVRGDLIGTAGKLQLKVAETKDILDLVADPKNAPAFGDAEKRMGKPVILHGVMTPGKDLKAATPLKVDQVR